MYCAIGKTLIRYPLTEIDGSRTRIVRGAPCDAGLAVTAVFMRLKCLIVHVKAGVVDCVVRLGVTGGGRPVQIRASRDAQIMGAPLGNMNPQINPPRQVLTEENYSCKVFRQLFADWYDHKCCAKDIISAVLVA